MSQQPVTESIAVAIVGDGHTDKLYFDSWKAEQFLPSFVRLFPSVPKKKGDYSGVFKKASELAASNTYDKIFALIDRDQILHQGTQSDYEKAVKNLSSIIQVIELYPCFELWFLLHFQSAQRPFLDCSETEAELCEKYISAYSKTNNPITFEKQQVFEKLKERGIETAIANSEKLSSIRPEDSPNFALCGMHHLVKYLKNKGVDFSSI